MNCVRIGEITSDQILFDIIIVQGATLFQITSLRNGRFFKNRGIVVLNKRVIEDFFPTHSFLFLDFEHASKQILDFLASDGIFRESERLGFNVLKKLDLTVTNPRGNTIKHFVEDNTDTPNITFIIEGNTIENLRGHIERRTQSGKQSGIILFNDS